MAMGDMQASARLSSSTSVRISSAFKIFTFEKFPSRVYGKDFESSDVLHKSQTICDLSVLMRNWIATLKQLKAYYRHDKMAQLRVVFRHSCPRARRQSLCIIRCQMHQEREV